MTHPGGSTDPRPRARVLLCAALGPWARASVAEAFEPRIAAARWIADAPTRIADHLGLFTAEHGAPVRVRLHDSGKAALASLLDGRAEFALAASSPVARALLEPPPGGDVRVLASISESSRTQVLLVAGQDGVPDSPRDLRGRRIAVLPGSSAPYARAVLRRHHGLSGDRARTVPIPVADHRGALREGRIDGAVPWEPWASELRNARPGGLATFPMRSLHPVNRLLVTRADHLEAHPGLAPEMLEAYPRGSLAEAIRAALTRGPGQLRPSERPREVDADQRFPAPPGVAW